VHVAMVLKALTCLVKEKNKNKHQVSALLNAYYFERLFRNPYYSCSAFFLNIHGRLSGQFSGSPAAFGKLKQAP
jgi:hypothetical protein